MKAILLTAMLGTIFFANASEAFCQLAATEGAPAIPAGDDTSPEELRLLGEAVQRYIDTASAQLANCKDSSEGLLHNVAVLELENTARRYNQLTRRYQQAAR